jgi:hypothetical protein
VALSSGLPEGLLRLPRAQQEMADLHWRAAVLGVLTLWGSGVAAQAYRYRRVSGPVERQQAKWVMFTLGSFMAIIALGIAIPGLFLDLPDVWSPPSCSRLSQTRSTWTRSRMSCWAWSTGLCSQRRLPYGSDQRHRPGRVVDDEEDGATPTRLDPYMPLTSQPLAHRRLSVIARSAWRWTRAPAVQCCSRTRVMARIASVASRRRRSLNSSSTRAPVRITREPGGEHGIATGPTGLSLSNGSVSVAPPHDR